ncbi:PAF1 [Lepeophtheirus salmonis]|uniref:RNA polymerase II-associated factor 1 homolog n=1 Tax=Lepeophtheirus salmonis TaxID=72036 RepID=A0A7R8H2X6_LEPSM|nr:PAF1 [Lepeophtheirus salmonis]CAF2831452.1 PAF1 [Lepeophtheirus salmonis]
MMAIEMEKSLRRGKCATGRSLQIEFLSHCTPLTTSPSDSGVFVLAKSKYDGEESWRCCREWCFQGNRHDAVSVQAPTPGATATPRRSPMVAATAPPPTHREKRSEMVCRVKYSNTLPDIPFDPKFISYPFESSRFINYNPTSLERNYKYELLTEQDLGVRVDLILPDAFEIPCGAQNEELHPKDEKLLEDEMGHLAQGSSDLKRSARHAQVLSWMRRPDYISTEQTRYQPTTIDKVESKIGFVVRKNLGNETALYMDREAQTTKCGNILVPKLFLIRILLLLVSLRMLKLKMMSQAMIRGVMDESGEQFVAYFLPAKDTMEKRHADFEADRDYADEEEYEYKMAREYNWNVKSKANKGYEENFFFVVRNDGIYYNELETRVRLSKRRLKAGQQPSNSKLVVKHRPLNKQEHRMQRYREKNLEPPMEEDEDVSEEEEEEEETNVRETREDRSRSKSASPGSKSVSPRSKSGSHPVPPRLFALEAYLDQNRDPYHHDQDLYPTPDHLHAQSLGALLALEVFSRSNSGSNSN